MARSRSGQVDGSRTVATAGLRSGRVLQTPIEIGGATIRNRLYRAPVLEGAGDGDDAAELLRASLRRERPPRRRPDHPGFVLHLPGGTHLARHDVRRHPGEDAAPRTDGGRASMPKVRRSSSSSVTAASMRWRRGTNRSRRSDAGPILAAAPVRAWSAAGVPRCSDPRHDGGRDPRHGGSVWRRRGLDAGGRLRRRATRVCQREAARPVPVAVLQPTHRRVRRIAREPRPHPAAHPRSRRRTRGSGLSVHGEGARRNRTDEVPARDPRRRASSLHARRGMGLRRGHAGRGVGVPEHDTFPRRHAGLVEPSHGLAAPRAPRPASAAARSSRPAPDGVRAARTSSPCGIGP